MLEWNWNYYSLKRACPLCIYSVEIDFEWVEIVILKTQMIQQQWGMWIVDSVSWLDKNVSVEEEMLLKSTYKVSQKITFLEFGVWAHKIF